MEWISVSNRLPERGAVVIIRVHGYSDIGWYDADHELWRTDLAIYNEREITHWMHLPPAPKEDA